MLKRIPYNNNLVTIGNAPVYDGKPVYSDGHVVYGWVFPGNIEKPNVDVEPKGFWIGKEGGNRYHLVNKSLGLGRAVGSRRHGDIQCFPCYATIELTGGYLPEHGSLFCLAGMYDFSGAVVSIDGAGNMLVYDDYVLHFLSPGSQRTGSHGSAIYYGDVLVVYNGTSITARFFSVRNGEKYVYYDDFVLLAEYSNDTLTVYDTDGTVLYSGSGSVDVTGNKVPALTCSDVSVPLDILDYSVIAYDNYVSYKQDDNGFDIYNGTVHISYGGQSDTANYYSTNDGYIYVYTDNDQLKAEYFNGEITVYDEYGAVEYTGVGNVSVSGGQPVTLQKQYIIGQHEYSKDIRKIFQLATTEKCYLRADTPDRDNDGDIIYTGDYNVVFEMVISTGTADRVTDQGGDVQLFDGNGDLIAYNVNDAVYMVVNGQSTYVGTGSIFYTANNDYEIRLFVDGFGGAGYYEYNGSDMVVTDAQGNFLAVENGDMLDVYYNAALAWQGVGHVDVRNTTPVEYMGNYTVRRDISGYSYDIKDPQGDVEVTDGTMHAVQSGNTVTIEDNGVVVYDDDGWIDTSNLVLVSSNPDVYRGDYTIRRDISGYGRIVPGANILSVYDTQGDIVADSSGGVVNVYDNTGAVDWTGPGRIDTSNLVPCKWFAARWEAHCGLTGSGKVVYKTEDGIVDTYVYDSNDDLVANEDDGNVVVPSQQYNGAGYISVTNRVMLHSIKPYRITPAAGCVENQYPANLQAGDDVVLNLNNDMALEITTQQGTSTVGNDPLNLLHTKSFVYAAGVHAWKNFVISQDGNSIYCFDTNMASETYDTIEKCFSLAWLTKKWKA